MRFQCINPNCGRTVDVDAGQLPPKFCTSCGSTLAEALEQATPIPATVSQGAKRSPGTVFRRLSEVASKTQSAPVAVKKARKVDTGILTRAPVKGPPAPEPEDIPLFHVVAAPSGIPTDEDVPRKPVAGQAVQQTSPVSTTTTGDIGFAEASSESSDDALFSSLNSVGLEDARESSPASSNAGGGTTNFSDLTDQQIDEQIFVMLAAQLPGNIQSSSATEPTDVPEALPSESSSPASEPPEPEVKNSPAPAPVPEELSSPDDELMSALAESEDTETGGDSGSSRGLPKISNWNDFPAAAHLIGDVDANSPFGGRGFIATVLESLRYPLRGKGLHVLALYCVLWIAATVVVMKAGVIAAAPIMLIQLILISGAGLGSIVLGTQSGRASLKWPLAPMASWWATAKCLLRFTPVDLTLAAVSFVAGKYLHGYLLLPPIFLVTTTLILCADTRWTNVFDPKRHLGLLSRDPAMMAKILSFGVVLGMLIPVVVGATVNLFIGDKVPFWMFRIAYWFCLSGPVGWIAGTAGGYGIGILYSGSQKLNEDYPPNGYENAVGAGLFVTCLLLSLIV